MKMKVKHEKNEIENNLLKNFSINGLKEKSRMPLVAFVMVKKILPYWHENQGGGQRFLLGDGGADGGCLAPNFFGRRKKISPSIEINLGTSPPPQKKKKNLCVGGWGGGKIISDNFCIFKSKWIKWILLNYNEKFAHWPSFFFWTFLDEEKSCKHK